MTSMRKALFAASLAVGLGLVAAPTASADILHLDDVIITFSACVGNDCVNGESFGFDTLRLKENNLRINFADTSNSSSFPTNDWRIVINSNQNGGADYFAIEDSSAGRFPFLVEAGAPANSLYVDDGGRIGLGTSMPVVDVHVVSGNTPTLRLEQDGSSGFAKQTFDVAANEANFFIRDVTNGSQLPFKIKPGADHNALFIAANNNIGMRTDNPSANLHVRDTSAGVAMKLEGNGATYFELTNTANSGSWFTTFDSAGDYNIAHTSTGGAALLVSKTGDVTIRGNCMDEAASTPIACDAVFEPAYELPSIEEHAESMWENKHLPAIGPTPEGKRVSLSLQKRHYGMLNELEKAHIYIEQLNEKLNQKSTEVDEMAGRLARLEALLAVQ